MTIVTITLITIFLILIFVLTASYLSYRIAFYAPKRLPDAEVAMPVGEQYEKHRPGISKSVEDMLARPFEPVTITSHDGKKLYARYYYVAENAPLQIFFHGYKSSAELDCCGGSKLAAKLGQNTLVADQRSHGKSEGSCITFGIQERRDCLTWIQYALTRFGKDTKIILSGLSMGAATVLMATDLSLPPNVVGVIADCPYSSPKAIIQKVSRDMHLPARIVYPFVKLGAKIFGGFDLEESSALSAVANTNIPILLIHGEDDHFVPCDMSRSIHKACASQITFQTVPGAGHGLSYMVAPEIYEKVTTDFIHTIL